MKYIFIILSIFILAAVTLGSSCNQFNNTEPVKNLNIKHNLSGQITIEGCQYFVIKMYDQGLDVNNTLVHKGNCNNPIHFKYQISIDSTPIDIVPIKIKVKDSIILRHKIND